MVTEAILTLIFGVLKHIINFIPETLFELPEYSLYFFKMVAAGLSFFPADLFRVCVANILFWILIQYGWSFVEWVYKKIPGVD
ncbi:MAG: hypothetical protein K2I03_12320 [Lachnospiraceae bacterium]|nr:hypothetical protein [Lachnospiraceae bacterium]